MLKRKTGAKILHNSLWYSIEMVLETVVFLGTSIAVARYLGPDKLGYFSYVNFFVTIVTQTGGDGLSNATRKYMSEFLALDRPGTARAVYELAYRYQLIGAIAFSLIGLVVVGLFSEPGYRIMSAILLISIVPGLMSSVPAQANQAFEDVAQNTISAFGYLASYAVVILLTLYFRWDLIGIASASLIGRTTEVFLRTIPLNKKLRLMPLDVLDTEIVVRIRRFCVQATGAQLLRTVIWNRSELIFLKMFSSLEQIAFYSVSYSLTSNLLTPARIFVSSTGVSLMVEAIANPKRVDPIVRNACRFLLVIIFPIAFGAAAITTTAVRLTYGQRYAGAVAALVVSAILTIPRAFQLMPDILIRTADRQNGLLIWYGVTGVLNVALDLLLIPRYGAVGAAWGNGLAQLFGVVVTWREARKSFVFSFPVGSAIRIGSASAIMALIAYAICRRVPGWPGLVLAVVAATVSNIILLRLFGGLDRADRERLEPIGNKLPGPVRRVYLATVGFVTASGA